MTPFSRRRSSTPSKTSPGLRCIAALGQPLQDQGHRQDGPAVDHVRLEHGRRRHVQPPFEDRGQRRGRAVLDRPGPRAGTSPAGRCGTAAEDHDLDGPVGRRPEFRDEVARARRRRDQRHALGLEHRPERRRDHAAVPGAPVDRDHPARRTCPGLASGPSCSGPRWPPRRRPGPPAEPRGRGREQDEGLQVVRRRRPEQGAQARDLGVVDRANCSSLWSSIRRSASTPAPWIRPRTGPNSARTSSSRRRTAAASRTSTER